MSEKIERCCACYDPTGHAGVGDGSHYTDSGHGPFCDSCYEGAKWADAELYRLREENTVLRNVQLGDEDQLRRVVDQNAALRNRIVEEHQEWELKEQENSRLRSLAERCEDTEGMAKAIYEHMFPDRDGWEKETDEWLKSRYRDNAAGVQRFLKGA